MTDYDLDKPIFKFSSQNETSHFTARHAFEGVQIFGGIGSGKTSGSGALLAHKYLKDGWGGLVLTAKPTETKLWKQYCKATGRSSDLIIIEPRGNKHFNFLNYESSTAADTNAITENIVDVLKTVIRAGEATSSGKNDDPFWETALDLLLFNVVDLCRLAYGKISLKTIYSIVQTIPKSYSEIPVQEDEQGDITPKAFHLALKAAQANILRQIDDWSNSMDVQQRALIWESPDFDDILTDAVPDAGVYQYVEQFFNDTFVPLSEKTRSIIDFSFTGFLFRMLRNPVYSLFCRHSISTVTPEDSLKGKIILLNLPVKTYHKVGRDCQILFKYIWQRAMEKRDVSENGMPVFLWADEAQNFLHEHDADYQATARSSRISTVYISQNLPNYYACMGGDKSEYRVKSFLGTLGTKIFHANADIETNKYASELIGDAFFEEYGESVTYSKQFSASQSKSLRLERMVRPEEFVKLRTGGPLNNFRVEGYLHRQGDTVLKGQNYIKMLFSQNN